MGSLQVLQGRGCLIRCVPAMPHVDCKKRRLIRVYLWRCNRLLSFVMLACKEARRKCLVCFVTYATQEEGKKYNQYLG